MHVSTRHLIIEKINEGAKNSLFLEDKDLINMFDRDNEFRMSYRKAINFYILGVWGNVEYYLKICLKIKVNDGPSRKLLNYI